VTIVRVGATEKYSEGWESAFGKGKASRAKPASGKPAAKHAAAKTTAAKAASPKKAAGKKEGQEKEIAGPSDGLALGRPGARTPGARTALTGTSGRLFTLGC